MAAPAAAVLILVSGKEGNGVPFSAVNAMIAEHAADMAHSQIRVVNAAGGSQAWASHARGAARILLLFEGQATPAELAALPGAAGMSTRIVVRECGDGASEPQQQQQQEVAAKQRLEALKHAALLSGLELLSAGLLPTMTPELTVRRAQFELGTAARLPLRRKGGGAEAFAKAAAAPPAGAGAEDGLIDEDALLTEEDMARPIPKAAGSDCAPKRKACKNCTCGRAEEEEQQEEATRRRVPDSKMGQEPSPVQLSNPYLTDEQINNPKSACGSVRPHLLFVHDNRTEKARTSLDANLCASIHDSGGRPVRAASRPVRID